MIEFDVETTGLQWYAEEMFMAQFLGRPMSEVNGPEADLRDHPSDQVAIQNWLNQDVPFRAWNSKFDLHFLDSAGYGLPPEHQWHDGMVMAHIVDERKPVALQIRADLLLGEERAGSDTERAVKEFLAAETKERRKASKNNGVEFIRPNYSDVPRDIMEPYAAHDVLIQRQVCNILERTLSTNDELRDVYELERGVLRALYHVEKRGIPIDRGGAAAYEAWVIDQLDAALEKCKAIAGIDTFNPGSSAQIAEALERADADLSNVTKGKNGNLSMDAENLGTVDHELATAVLEFRGLQKSLSTYLRPMLHASETQYGMQAPFLGTDDRLHPNFRQVGARTGRMSCSDPNVQNWNRDDLSLRYLIRAGEGKKLVTADLDAIEIRLFAALCGDGLLRRTLLSGEDIHTLTAGAIGIGDRTRTGGHVESARQRGKTFNYAIIYGAGIRSIRKNFGVSQDGARAMLNRYHDTYPEVGEFQNRIEFTLEDRGYVKSPWGRHHRVVRNAEREAYKFTNYLVQGAAADLVKDALVKIHDAGVPVVNVVHDEIIAEVDEADAEEAGRIIQEAMTNHEERIPSRIMPLKADYQIVDRLSDAKQPGFVPEYEGA